MLAGDHAGDGHLAALPGYYNIKDPKMILLHDRILRGFPFGNDIMPARSAAVDLYSASLPPRHRAAAGIPLINR